MNKFSKYLDKTNKERQHTKLWAVVKAGKCTALKAHIKKFKKKKKRKTNELSIQIEMLGKQSTVNPKTVKYNSKWRKLIDQSKEPILQIIGYLNPGLSP